MKTIRTVCARDCYDTCTLQADVDDDNRIRAVKADPDHPITRGITCPRGAADGKRLNLNRIDGPHVRKSGKHLKTGWQPALDRVAEKLKRTLREHGPSAVLHLDYAGNVGMLTRVFPKRLWNAIGATQTDGAVCSKSGHAALSLHYGASYGQQPEDVLHKRLIVFWGMNAAVSFPHLWHLACKARKESDARIAVIDPRLNATAEKADLHLQPRPGSDVALAYGLLNYLIQHDAADKQFIAQWTRGFEQLADRVRNWTIARTAATTGVEADHLTRLGKWLADRKPSVTNIGIGLQKCDRGADQVRAAAFIPAVLGLHRGFFYGNGAAWNIDGNLVSGRSLSRPVSKVVAQVAVADLIGAGQFKFIFISGMNPAVTLPNTRAFETGIQRQDVFTVVQDGHWTDTARLADVVLPVPLYLEKDDLIIPWTHRYVNFNPGVADPVVDCRSEVDIMQSIARRLGRTENWLFENPWPVLDKAFENAFENGGLADLKSGKTLRLRTKPLQAYPTPSGRIEFAAASAEGFDPMPVASAAERGADECPFVLLTSATRKYTHTQFQETFGRIPAVVEINPGDAKKLGLLDGQPVLLENDQGSVRVLTQVTDRVPPKTLWCPRQFVDAAGTPQNSLMSSRPQQIGKGPRFNSTRVRVRPDKD